MARASKVDLDCEASFAAAAVRVVGTRTEEVFEQASGVLDLGDVERVHDMRVATRRLRAALETFEPCFPGKPWRKALKRVKALADALGKRRDLDVEIELLEGLSGEIAEDDRFAVAALIEGLREGQRRANDDLTPFVEAKSLAKLRRRLERLVTAAGA